ncbi:MAG TPA: hypothetical protein VGH80_05645 [Xanthomonadaceae bacterium]|jgi:hypothetical protein
MYRKPGSDAVVAQFALAALALVLAVALAWPIYVVDASHIPDVHSSSVVGPSDRDLWWMFGGYVAGAVAACIVLALLWFSATRRGESLWVLSVGANLGVAIGSALIAGFLFQGIHAEQYRRQQQIAAEESIRRQEIDRREQARLGAKAVETQRRWDQATQGMGQLEVGSVASTLAAAEAQSPAATLDSLRDGFEPFLDSHPWRTLTDDDRTAFGAFARRALNTMRSENSEVSVVLGMVVGAEHGLADTHGAMDECARLHATTACRDAVASLALYLCRNGPACLDGYEGMDFARLSKDIAGAATWSCNAHTQMRDTELCAYVRGEKP